MYCNMDLINKNKSEVIKILGNGLNYYHLDTWVYLLDCKWWERKKKLYIYFDEKNQVYLVKIKLQFF